MEKSDHTMSRPRSPPRAALVGRMSSKAAIKRTFDIAAAVAALLLLAPLFLVLICLVKRDGGAAFYAQRRVGRDGCEFRCLKFRTMLPNADHHLKLILASDPVLRLSYETYWKLKDDPRVTPIGRILRRFSLDELPQLINVLSGEMSIVGPRPRSQPEMKHMDEFHSASSLYTMVRPGITGLWQVSGRNTLTLAQKANLDASYAKGWTLTGDMVLIARTVDIVLSGHGAH